MKYGLFFVEGQKSVSEFLNMGFNCDLLLSIEETYLNTLTNNTINEKVIVTKEEMKQVSDLTTPTDVLAVFAIRQYDPPKVEEEKWYLGLENIQDPGNMGTLIRTADWFGISDVFLSPNCVDVYNPKVVQASMGSIARVQCHSCDLNELIQTKSMTSYAATLSGKNYKSFMKQPGIILIGNEGKGLTEELINNTTQQITIPGANRAESLNAAIAGAILMAKTID